MPAQHSLTSPHVNKRRMIHSLYITPKSFKIFKKEKGYFFFGAGAKKTPPFQELCRYSLLYSYISSGHQTAVC